MKTIIYSHYHKELDKDIGHLDENGVVYSHPVKEVGYAIGRVDDKGIVRTHPTATFDYDVGRAGPDGKIYDHSAASVGHCIGHVDENGVIYSHSNSELGYEIGHVSGPLKKRAAAAYMLLMWKGETPPQAAPSRQKEEEPVRPVTREEPVQAAPRPARSTSNGGGGLGGFLGFMAIALALGFLKSLWEFAVKYPGMVWMAVLVVIICCIFKPPKGVGPADLQVSEAGREQCKQQAKSTAIKYSLVPLVLAIYTLYTNGTDFTAILFSAVPVLTTYFAIHRVAYMRNLVQEEEQERVAGPRRHAPPKAAAPQDPPKPAASAAPRPKAPAAAPRPKANAAAPTPEKVIAACPGCRAKCRVPSGQGRIKIKCPACGNKFETVT